MDPIEQPTVQVSSELLHSLISSVNSLRNDVSHLRDSNAALASEIQRLQEISEVRCSRFSKLPTEIRNIIWHFALSTPQTHIISMERISRSKSNVIMQACREARLLGLKLEMPYFRTYSRITRELRDTKHYINLEHDTFYITEESHLVENVEFFCGRCGGAIFSLKLASDCPHEHRLRHLAIHDMHFKEPDYLFRLRQWATNPDTGTGDLLWRLKVNELIIIVGAEPPAEDRDVTFVGPTAPTSLLLPSFGTPLELRGIGADNPEPFSVAWALASSRVAKVFSNFKDARINLRKEAMEGM
jgi:hypothetical protein